MVQWWCVWRTLMCSMSFSGLYLLYSTARSEKIPEWALSRPRPWKSTDMQRDKKRKGEIVGVCVRE